MARGVGKNLDLLVGEYEIYFSFMLLTYILGTPSAMPLSIPPHRPLPIAPRAVSCLSPPRPQLLGFANKIAALSPKCSSISHLMSRLRHAFLVCFRPLFPEEEILGPIAPGPIIRVFKGVNLENRIVFKHDTFSANYPVGKFHVVAVTRRFFNKTTKVKKYSRHTYFSPRRKG